MNTMEIDAQNWQGVDASLKISLEEYRILWRETDNDKNERYQFIMKVREKYDWTELKEYDLDWIDKTDICSFVGMDKNEWNNLPLPRKVYDVCCHYGTHEFIFYPRVDKVEING